MTALETRAGFGLELRRVDDRILEGIALPYGETSYMTADPRGERFLAGSLNRTIRDRGMRLKLFLNHDHSHAIGKALKLDPRHPDGLWARFGVFATPSGDEALSEVEQGALDMFSVGFIPVRERRANDGVREVLEAAVHEVSLCPLGAYDGARVLATRSANTDAADGADVADIRQWLQRNPVPALDLTPPPPVWRPLA
jgi:HK97 family phage prohead protease